MLLMFHGILEKVISGVIIGALVFCSAVYFDAAELAWMNWRHPLDYDEERRSLELSMPPSGEWCSLEYAQESFRTPEIRVCYGGADSSEGDGEAKWHVFFNSDTATSIIEQEVGARNREYIGSHYDFDFYILTQNIHDDKKTQKGRFEVIFSRVK